MINPETFLLAEISENIKSLQLQLDYEKSRLTTALGGDPVLYDVAGTGAIIGGSGKFGTGSAIAGATLQVDGDLVVGDGAGGTVGKITATGIIEAKRFRTGILVIGDDSVGLIQLSFGSAGILLLMSNSSPTMRNAIVSFRADTNPFCSLISGANIAVTTGVLVGTTGSDVAMTISAHSDYIIYVENRTGATRSIRYMVIA